MSENLAQVVWNFFDSIIQKYPPSKRFESVFGV